MTTARLYGPITNDAAGLGLTRHLVGGEGACRWKQLVNGMHLNGAWNCVEYVVIPRGASCGEHLHSRTEEIYYIIEGHALMKVDGEPLEVHVGDVITTPIGAAHTIANHMADDMHFFVVEVFPGAGIGRSSERIPAREGLTVVEHHRNAVGPVRHSWIDLESRFSGDWIGFGLTVVPPGGSIGQYTLDDRVEVVMVTDGRAAITVDAETVEGGRGLCVAYPPGTVRRIDNAGDDALEFIATEVKGS